MESLTFQIASILISLIGVLVSYLLIPYIKSKTTEKQREDIMFWVKVAVNAAEQIYKEKGNGKLKKEYVVKFLNDIGIKISEFELDVLIESAVLELDKIKEGNK